MPHILQVRFGLNASAEVSSESQATLLLMNVIGKKQLTLGYGYASKSKTVCENLSSLEIWTIQFDSATSIPLPMLIAQRLHAKTLSDRGPVQ